MKSKAPSFVANTHPAFASFAEMPLDERLKEAIAELGFLEPTAIQAQAIGPLLDGKDIIGRARTGSGKTLAFGLPLLQALLDGDRAVQGLILAPTRELALQVTDALRKFAHRLPVRIVTIYGGASFDTQFRALRAGVNLVVGTPGRVLDHVRRKTLDLSKLKFCVLDEADEMLRMGFLEDVDAILDTSPPTRQVALFSATMPKDVERIARAHLREPVEVHVESAELTVDHIEQRFISVAQHKKVPALARVLAAEDRGATLVFSRLRSRCGEVADALTKHGLNVDALHGDLSQPARERVLARFRANLIDVVVATDVAARGLDVEHITHVINLDMPDDPEVYVHRIGRTGRAGRHGHAISFVPPKERMRLKRFETVLKCQIKPMEIPTDADIAARQNQRLKTDIQKTLDDGIVPEALAFVQELVQESGFSSEDVAAALLDRMAKENGVAWRSTLADFEAAGGRESEGRDSEGRGRSDRGSRNRRERADFDGPSRDRSDDGGQRRGPPKDRKERVSAPRLELSQNESDIRYTDVSFPVGQNAGVEPRDLVGALAHTTGLQGRYIHNVRIERDHSSASIPEEVAVNLAKEGFALWLRGNEVPLIVDRTPMSGIKRRAHSEKGPPVDGKKYDTKRPAKSESQERKPKKKFGTSPIAPDVRRGPPKKPRTKRR